MGVDTKSGPMIQNALAELGGLGEQISDAINPTFNCNAANESRSGMTVKADQQGFQQNGGNLSAGDARNPSGAFEVNSPPLKIPQQISPSLNPRGPVGAGGHQFPRVDPQFSSVPGGGGVGAKFGNAGGNQTSPTYGAAKSGDISINDSGGWSASVSTGAQPALTVDHGPQSIENPQDTYPPIQYEDTGFPEGGGGSPGGGGGGGGGPGPPGQVTDKDPCKPVDTPCDFNFDGTVCAEKVFADNLHLRWGTVAGSEMPKYPGTGQVKLTPIGKKCTTTESVPEEASTTVNEVGQEPDAGQAQNENEEELPPCPPDDNAKKQAGVDEHGAREDGEPNNNAVGGAGAGNNGAGNGGNTPQSTPSNSTSGSVAITLGPDAGVYG
ncbi:MAG: hypothetical protein CMI60_06355 [Parvibaculum sp.]|nr:hypothetical protein [Parvibaculum sp.]